MKLKRELDQKNVANGIMATTGQNSQFKVNKMPEELLFQPFPSLNARQLFKPKMEPYEFANSMGNLTDKISAMRRIFEKSISDHGRTGEKQALEKQFERQAVDCIRNNCSSDFMKDYGREMAGFETEKDCFNFLESIFGSETEEERRARAAEDLEDLTRRSEKNEKFSSFLKRIKSIAAVISDKADAQKFIVDQHFSKNLEPCNKTFLKDHGFSRKTTDEISQFLDERERYLNVNISALQTNDFAAFFADKTSEILDRKFAQMEINHESKNAELTETIKTLTATVARLEADNKKKSEQLEVSKTQNSRNFRPTQPVFQPPTLAYNGHFPGAQQQFGFPVPPRFCINCRESGHFKSVCPKIQCYECKQFGHISRNCPQRQAVHGEAQKN